MVTLRLALAQITSSRDVPQNISLLREYVRYAAEADADLVVFLEASMLSFAGPLKTATQKYHRVWQEAVRTVAQEYSLAVVAGRFVPEGERVRNQLQLVCADGREYTYAKIHLFDAFGFAESDTVAPGNELLMAEVAGVKIGLSICYDVRFAQLYTQYARAGADIILASASWGAGPGKVDQWRLLTSARALDSTTYLIAVDQADPGSTAGTVASSSQAPLGVGYSRAVDPWGRELVELGRAPELRVIELDTKQVAEARRALPVLRNAKLDY